MRVGEPTYSRVLFRGIVECMCGICGVFHHQPVEAGIITDMTTAMIHRGPDGDGYLWDNNVALGFRRLAIIDLVTGDQPIYNEDRRIAVVFNGEIYNFRDLRSELMSHGHIFQTETDTEVLVHGYEQWGVDVLHRLRGMFAFAIWDSTERQLFLARDRMGQKPLYYAQASDGFWFASEIKALTTHLPATLNRKVVPEYLAFGYVLPPYTLFNDIYKLAPGHYLLVKNGAVSETVTYWMPQLTPQPHANDLRTQIDTAVQLRLMGDVPYGAFLSGGIDSSTIAARMMAVTQSPVQTFTVGFDYEKNSSGDQKFNVDLHAARQVAKAINCNHHELIIRHESPLAELLRQLVYALDEPIADPAIIQTAFVTALARHSGVPILLGGDAADELYAGYAFFAQDQRVQRYGKAIPHIVRQHVINHLPLGGRLRKLNAKSLLRSPIERFLSWEAPHPLDTLPELLVGWQPELLNHRLKGANRILREHVASRWMADYVGYARLRFWLAENNNMRMDKIAMWMSVEARAPFQDHLLVENALQIPLESKLPSKAILRQAVKGWIPDFVLDRPKWGFTPPASDWLRTVLRPLIDTYITVERSEALGLNHTRVQDLVNQHMQREGYYLHQLWSLLLLHMWHAVYIEDEKPVRWSATDMVTLLW